MTAPPSVDLESVPPPALRKSLANLIALACIQVANALLPLVAYPLILGTVGAEHFSRVVVTESIMLVVLALVVYSFDVEGVSNIVGLDTRTDASEISAVFSEILTARLLILGVCLVALVAVFPFIDRTTFLLLAGWMLFPLSYILQSTWFFQGRERNVFPAAVIVASRLTCLLLVRAVIVHPGDFYLAPLIIGASYAAGGSILLAYIILVHRVRVHLVSPVRIRTTLSRGREIFAGNLSVTLYRGSNVLILNAVGTSAAVVAYSIAEKTIKLFQAGAGPLNQLFFPKVIRALAGVREPSRRAFRTVLRYTIPQLAALAVGAVVVAASFMFFRGFLPAPFRSAQAHEILTLVGIMAATVFFGVANFMFGTGGLNYLGQRRYFAMAIFATGVCNVALCAALVFLFAAKGAAMSFVLAEILLFAGVARAYFKRTPATA